jgi:hypothetical protein
MMEAIHQNLEVPAISAVLAQALPPVDAQPIALQQRAADLVAAADRALIDSGTTMEQGATLDKMIQTVLKKLDEERTSWVKPLNEYVKRINGRFKFLTEPLEKARGIVKSKMIAYRQEQDRLAAEAAERARKEAEEHTLQIVLALEAEGKTAQAEAVLEQAVDLPPPPPPPPVPAGPVRSDIGAVSSIVDDWQYRVLDEFKVPREFLCLDDRKIRAAIKGKDGLRNIAGLEVINQPRMMTR